MAKQKTLQSEIKIEGNGIHSNLPVKLTLKPSEPNTGITFRRVDKDPAISIPVAVENLAEATPLRQTTLEKNGACVKTVEHLLAALYSSGIHNVAIDIDQEELPALDGGAQEFWNAVQKAGIVDQGVDRPALNLNEAVKLDGKKGSSLEYIPADDFSISYTLSYDDPDLEDQFLDLKITEDNFDKELAGARTFCLKSEMDFLLQAGFGKGATYENTLVFDKNEPTNNTLRYPNEAVRHKVVDLIGDLSLLGVELKGRFIATKSGHSQNIEMVKSLKKQFSKNAGGSEVKKNSSKSDAVIPGTEFDIHQIQNILPHRYPFLFVDKIIEFVPYKKAVGIKNVTINEDFFQGHFPGHPVMPGVLIVEAMAQVSGIIMLNSPEHYGSLAYFMGIDDVKFRVPVVPGDQLRLEVNVTKAKGRYGVTKGKAYVGDKLVCQAEMKFSFVSKENSKGE